MRRLAGLHRAGAWWPCYAGLTFCYSALAAVLPALSTDLFGFPHAGVNYGFLALGQSVGSLAFPFAANFCGLEAGSALDGRGSSRWPDLPAIRALRPVEPSRWARTAGHGPDLLTELTENMTNARRKADRIDG